MPLPTVIAMGKKAGKSKGEVESLWKQAKQIAKEELGLNSDKDLEKQSSRGYKYSMGIFKKMIGINESLIKEQGYKYKVSVPERQADQFRMKIEKYLNWDEYGESKSNGNVIFSFTDNNYKQIETFVKQYSKDIKVKEQSIKEKKYVELPGVNIDVTAIGRDRNGNKIIALKPYGSNRAFSIQTNKPGLNYFNDYIRNLKELELDMQAQQEIVKFLKDNPVMIPKSHNVIFEKVKKEVKEMKTFLESKKDAKQYLEEVYLKERKIIKTANVIFYMI